MNLTEQQQQNLFENDVRRIARELWPEAQYQGAAIQEGRERDGVFETEECIHLIEATVSKTKAKAEEDSKKLANLSKKLQPKHHDKAIRAWFITKHEPTADQREAVKRAGPTILCLSFSQFQSRLVDAATYLKLRGNYPFGSVRNPETGQRVSEEIEYIALDLIESGAEKLWTVDEIAKGVLEGTRFMLLADYGAGKSMTLREIYRDLSKMYLSGYTSRFPVYINLRDHFGQKDPHEVLERHARSIGFTHPAHLVRAWRAGYAILLLDGFDELTTLGIQGLWRKLHELRYRAMEVVRSFIGEQPREAGIILTGRAHFFDSDKERRDALPGLSRFIALNLSEFNDLQIERYLKSRGLEGMVPNWMPSRPLLVGYLAASGVLQKALCGSREDGRPILNDPAEGWDSILDRVCEREAEIEAGIDGQTVRRILERLATIARQTQGGLGPITLQNMVTAFSDICGHQPDEKGFVLLQRLPGLGIDRTEEGTRLFLDEDFADVCRGGDILAYLVDPFGMTPEIFRGADRSIGGLCVGLLILRISAARLTSGKMIPALRLALETEDTSALVLDLVRTSMELGFSIDLPICLRDVYMPFLDIGAGLNDCSKLVFSECLITCLAIDSEVEASKLPKFHSCYIERVEGRSSRRDMPDEMLDANCSIDHFSEAPDTTSAISEMDLPLAARVLLSILKKVYLQSGSGRKENALLRGLDHNSRRLVGSVLRLLQAEGFVSRYKRAGLDMAIWVPDRSKSARARRIITSPRTCNDPLLSKVQDIS